MTVLQAQSRTLDATPRGMPRVRWIFIGLSAVLAGYLVSLIVRGGPTNPLADGWFVSTFELIAGSLCLARAFTRRRDRTVPILLGLAVMAWTAGDIVLNIETAAGPVSAPSFADPFYLAFYPLAYAVLLTLIRREGSRVLPGSWLDGAVAGLGAAAVCATFLFGPIERSLGGTPAELAVSLAYPVGDLVLLALAIGGSAVLSGSTSRTWTMVAAACAINAIGDTFNLIDSSQSLTAGVIIDGIAWPLAILVLALAVWVPHKSRDLLQPMKAPGFSLPAMGAACGLAVVFTGTVHPTGAVALALGTVTLMVAGLRFALSVRGMSRLTEQRRRDSVTDELTGLGNRRMLSNILDAFLLEQADVSAPLRRLAFLFVDLDHFKEINDSFGHAAGDTLLRQLGPRLQTGLRAGDALVRLGGDELGVVLMDTDVRDAVGIAERFLESLKRPFIVDGVAVTIGASIGIAAIPADAVDTEELLRCADVAMYRAKLSRSGVALYRQDIDDEGNRLRLADDLRVAVETRTLTLHFQPQVDLRSGDVVAVEALLRWQHPVIGQIPPLQFLPLAEELGLMGPLTELVLDQALAQCAVWRDAGTNLAVSVNVSATNLLEPGFVERVSGALQRHSLEPEACVLEITETTIIKDFQACKQVIEALRALGISVSIDDFGAGFTSLAYLGSLAVTELKLDRSFITGLTAESRWRDRELVRATIGLGHALGLRVVAEGIEDLASLEVLAQMGCDMAQGFYLGKPAPASELERALRPEVIVA